MNTLSLFTDASVNPQTKIGYGAILITDDLEQAITDLKAKTKIKRFENTSSTKLELQTLLWALGELEQNRKGVTIYTDSQNLVSLPDRRERLEANNFKSKNKAIINNAELYKAFYTFCDKLNLSIIKVKGHKQTIDKDLIDKIFSLVDRASRVALKVENNKT